MRARTILLAVPATVAAVALAGCGGDGHAASAGAGAHSMSGHASSMPKSSSVAGTHNEADVMFAQGMVPHHRQAVEMAELAMRRSTNTRVRALAARIRAAQDPEIRTMTGWLTGWRQPTAMSGMGMHHSSGAMMSAADMTELEARSGRAFDRAFLTGMTAHHRGAVSMARAERERGRYQPAVQLAGRIITSQPAEIADMRRLLEQL